MQFSHNFDKKAKMVDLRPTIDRTICRVVEIIRNQIDSSIRTDADPKFVIVHGWGRYESSCDHENLWEEGEELNERELIDKLQNEDSFNWIKFALTGIKDASPGIFVIIDNNHQSDILLSIPQALCPEKKASFEDPYLEKYPEIKEGIKKRFYEQRRILTSGYGRDIPFSSQSDT